ncbi:hypothetical protein DPMN_153975 [Dreissena polymorpha]|uniref:Uncharacterized protein n=1 Tax=Dreissena polymorpha TaxID=45954 RepID=A0A9D4FQW9_DREPO|nr:hypothetical protein DPMN_153975 [Dreissena polymorpha]
MSLFEKKNLQRRWGLIGHTQACIQCNKAISHLEPPREKEEKGLKKHLVPQLCADSKQMGKTWGQLERLAQNHDTWRNQIGGQCPRQDYI